MDVTLELIKESDIEALYPLGNDKDVSWMSGGGLTYPLTYEEFRTKKTITLSVAIGELETYVIRWGNKPVGSIGYFRREIDNPLEIGYWIGKEYWGMGIVSKALKLALDAMRKSGIQGKLIATTMADNIGSQHILLKCGFFETGTEVFPSLARGMDVKGVHFALEL